MKRILSSIVISAVLGLLVGRVSAAQTIGSGNCYVIVVNENEPDFVRVDCPFVGALTASPTAIVPISTATPTRTPTAQPTSTATATRTNTPSVTPTQVTGTPAPVPTYNGTCQWVLAGAEWAQPKGMLYYYYSDPAGTDIASQNIRSGPGISYSIVGQLPLNTGRLVWFEIYVGDQLWVAFDDTCSQWAAIWLGHTEIH
jgi:hypothetical protein